MSESVDQLWALLVSKLRAAGSDVSEIQECTPQVLQSVLVDLGFTALQSAKLQTEWTRRRSSSLTRSAQLASHPGAMRVTVSERSAEFVEIAQLAADALVQAGHCVILGVERVVNQTLEEKFIAAKAHLCRPTAAPVRKWRLLLLEDVDSVCTDGNLFLAAPVGAVAEKRLCQNGTVFYTQVERDGVADAALHGKGALKLVLFDVWLGSPKIVTEEDSRTLTTVSTDVIVQSLRQEGFDCLQVRRDQTFLPDVFVSFDNEHAIPRFVVTFSMASPPVALGLGGAGDGSVGQRSSLQYQCQKHPTKLYEFWSLSQKRLLCSHCLFVDRAYSQADCATIEDAAAMEAPWLQRWVANGEAFVADAGKVMAAFDAAIESSDANAREQTATLTRSIDDIKALLDELVSHTTKEIHRVTEEQIAFLHKGLAQLVAIQSKVEDLTTGAKSGLRLESPIDVLIHRQYATAKWQPLAIPQYFTPQLALAPAEFIASMQASLKLAMTPGHVDLPEVIDVNNLAVDCDTAMRGT